MASIHEVRIGLVAIVLQLDMIINRVGDANLDADLEALRQLAIITRDAADELTNSG